MNTQPEALPNGQILKVTPDGEFIWHEDADTLIERGDFTGSPAMPHILRRLRDRDRLHTLNAELLAALKDVVEDADDCDCLPNDEWCPLRHAERVIAKAEGEQA